MLLRTINEFKAGDIVEIRYCDGESATAKIIKGFVSYTIQILTGCEKGRIYDVPGGRKCNLISKS